MKKTNEHNKKQIKLTSQEYMDTYTHYANRIETVVKKMVFVLLVIVVIFQFLLQFSLMRNLLTSVDELEGRPFEKLNFNKEL